MRFSPSSYRRRLAGRHLLLSLILLVTALIGLGGYDVFGMQAVRGYINTLSSTERATLTMREGVWGTGIGVSGITVANLDGDPAQEMVLGGGYDFGRSQFWSVVSYDPTTQGYVPDWRSKEYTVWISRILVADTLPSPGLEIYVVLQNGQVEVYRATDRALLSVFTTSAQGFTNAVIGDLDQDGVQELALTNGSALYIYNTETQALEWQLALTIGFDIGLRDMAIGNVDNDSGLEVVTLRQVIDVKSHSIQWDRSSDYDTYIALADIDGDGKDELLSARAGWNDIRAFDVDTQAQKWSITTYGTGIDSIAVADIDRDGILDILCGSSQGAPLYAYNSVTRQIEWTMPAPLRIGGYTNLTIADTDSDGVQELLWGAGWSDTGTDRLFIVNAQNREVEWYNSDLHGPFSAVGAGDIDGDGLQEIVALPTMGDGWDPNGGIYVYDAATHRLKAQFGDVFGFGEHDPVIALAVADVNGDKRDDIVIGGVDSSNSSFGVIYVYDGTTHELKWKTAGRYGASYSAVTVADIDGDGQAEVIGGQRALFSDKAAGVYVLNGKTGSEEWHTPGLGQWECVYNIVTNDLDGDGHQEIVFSTQIDQLGGFVGNKAYIYDGVTHALDGSTSFTGIQVVASADLDGDHAQDLVIGTADGRLIAFDGKTAQQKWAVAVTNGPLLALHVATLESSSKPYIVMALTDRVVVLDPATWSLVWSSEFVGVPAGYGGQITVGNLDSNRHMDLVVGGRSAVYAWEWTAEIPPRPTAIPTPSEAPTLIPNQTPTPEPGQKNFHVFIPLIDSSKSSLQYRYSGN